MRGLAGVGGGGGYQWVIFNKESFLQMGLDSAHIITMIRLQLKVGYSVNSTNSAYQPT